MRFRRIIGIIQDPLAQQIKLCATVHDSVGELRTGCEYLRERRFVRLSQDTWCQIINNPNDIACRSGAEMLEMRFLQSNVTR